MSDNRLYNEFERSREAYWAHQQDVKALDAIRAELDAEKTMGEGVKRLRQKKTPL